MIFSSGHQKNRKIEKKLPLFNIEIVVAIIYFFGKFFQVSRLKSLVVSDSLRKKIIFLIWSPEKSK